ncbi:hypothetical protein SDC9_119142 [bioreactor metagenome]|uniref:Uncharacterized protein n=1 Tax=bioreactor metagenome TaxID=1076179 RepID=A0A645C3G9_9ZZZZ
MIGVTEFSRQRPEKDFCTWEDSPGVRISTPFKSLTWITLFSESG